MCVCCHILERFAERTLSINDRVLYSRPTTNRPKRCRATPPLPILSKIVHRKTSLIYSNGTTYWKRTEPKNNGPYVDQLCRWQYRSCVQHSRCLITVNQTASNERVCVCVYVSRQQKLKSAHTYTAINFCSYSSHENNF